MRMKLASAGEPLLLAAFVFGLSTTSAHAYLDAGTGSMILQLLLGGFAGLALVGKLYWHRLLASSASGRSPSRSTRQDGRALRGAGR